MSENSVLYNFHIKSRFDHKETTLKMIQMII